VTGVRRGIVRGAAAGAAGTTALNAVTYLDMALRGRPASSTQETTVEVLTDRTPLTVPGEGEVRDNRVSGLAPLLGIAAGLAAGAALGTVRSAVWRTGTAGSWAAASVLGLLAGNLPMTAIGVSDPREWSAEAWVSDLVPHVAYGLVTGWVLEQLDPRSRGRRAVGRHHAA
jgi:hypothetical protein